MKEYTENGTWNTMLRVMYNEGMSVGEILTWLPKENLESLHRGILESCQKEIQKQKEKIDYTPVASLDLDTTNNEE